MPYEITHYLLVLVGDGHMKRGFISQLTNLCKILAAAILLTSSTHFGARLGAFVYWTGCFENNVPFDNTAQLYL